MKIAITAPTGHIGSKLVELLQEQGRHQLVLLCRDPSKVEKAVANGARVAQGDLRDPMYVVDATRGVDVLFWLTPPNNAVADMMVYHHKLAENAARAIRQNKLKRVVNLSAIGANIPRGVGPIAGLHEVEDTLTEACEDADCAITHLRAAFFQENFEVFAPEISKSGTIALPVSGGAKSSMVATADIAKAAARLLTDTTWRGVNIKELVGPREYTFSEAAGIIGEAIGKDVHHMEVSPEQARTELKEHGASQDMAESYVEMYQAFDKGIVKPSATRGDVIKADTELEEFARDTLAREVADETPTAKTVRAAVADLKAGKKPPKGERHG